MKAYKYKWSRQYRVNPQVAGQIFQQYKDDNAVLDQAADPDNPLHSDFDWDDTNAARQHRLHQIRTMRCSLLVEVITKEQKTEHIRAFVRTLDKVGYVPVLEASDIELGAAEQQCWAQAASFKKRWKGLKFAREIVEAIRDKEKVVKRAVRKQHS